MSKFEVRLKAGCSFMQLTMNGNEEQMKCFLVQVEESKWN